MLRRYCAARTAHVVSRISSVRMHSTLVGDSGRIYRGGAVLRPNPQDRNLDILKTEFVALRKKNGNILSNEPRRSEGKSFIYKRVPKHVFNLSQQIANDCPSSRHLRMHVDCNAQESILIYPYFRDTFLALLEKDPAFPPDERGKIMRGVGEAIQELHSKDWIHAGLSCIHFKHAYTELTIFGRHQARQRVSRLDMRQRGQQGCHKRSTRRFRHCLQTQRRRDSPHAACYRQCDVAKS